jgi:hypothetical protein
MKACIHCKHAVSPKDPAERSDWQCAIAGWTTEDVVLGVTHYNPAFCFIERTADGPCGYAGKRWESRD